MKMIRNKATSIVIFFSMIVGMLQINLVHTFADSLQFTVDNIRYEVTGSSTVKVVNDDGYMSLSAVIIPDTVDNGSSTYNVTEIGDSAFDGCSQLSSVTLSASSKLTSIGSNAFSYCSFTSFYIPPEVTSVDGSAFNDCDNLTEFTADNSNNSFTADDGVLFSKDKTILVRYPINKNGSSYTIPDSVTEIGDYAFFACGLINITFDNNIQSIGEKAFCGCSVTNVTLGSNIQRIGNLAFSYSSLLSIDIPDGVMEIGDSAFDGSSQLSSVTLSASSKLTSIGSNAFSHCSFTSFYIPPEVTSVDGSAFNDCDKLTQFTVDNSNNSFTADDGILFSKDKKILVRYPVNKDGSSYTIPDSVTEIGDSSMRKLNNLTSVTIGPNITAIDKLAFSQSESIEYITFTGITPPDMSYDAFVYTGIPDGWKIVVPLASKGSYETALESEILSNCQIITNGYGVAFNLNGGTQTDSTPLTQVVPNGGYATSPTVIKAGYTLSWDPALGPVTDDTIYNAVWTAIPATGVSLDKSTMSLTAGGSAGTLIATVSPVNANNSVTWSSSDTNIATVDNGVVTPVAAGTATITVTTVYGNQTDTCTVTVSREIRDRGSGGSSTGNGENTSSSTSVTEINRLSGSDRISTAIEIAKAEFTGKVKNVILATADNYPDALSGSVLAYKIKAPILLIENSDENVYKVIDYMKSNMDSAGTVYILGGMGAVSSTIEEKLSSAGFKNITRLAGKDRNETSVEIANSLNVNTGTPIALVNAENYPDALSISSAAAVMQIPILFIQRNEISDTTKNEIKNIKPSKIYIIGLQGVISTDVENEAAAIASIDKSNIIRIGGNDRYETSLDVAKYFNLSGQSICVATGNDFPDALVGSVYAALNKASILLMDKILSDSEIAYLKNKKILRIIILGGEGAVSKDVEQQLAQILGQK